MYRVIVISDDKLTERRTIGVRCQVARFGDLDQPLGVSGRHVAVGSARGTLFMRERCVGSGLSCDHETEQ